MLKDLISRLLRPDPRIAKLIEARAQRPTWWVMHIMTSPPPRKLSAVAEKVRRAFLEPWLQRIEYLTDYADRETRSQTRSFWSLVCNAEEEFWSHFSGDDTTAWPAGTWPAVRDALYGYQDEEDQEAKDLFDDDESKTNGFKRR